MVSNYQIFCGCELCVLFWLGSVVSRVLGVGDMYVWSCGTGSGRIISGFVLVEQIGLVCVIMLHPASGGWEVCCLFSAARSAVATGPA